MKTITIKKNGVTEKQIFFTPSNEVEVHIVTITKKIAEKLLAMTNPDVQRRIVESCVQYLVDQLKQGQFLFNGDSICQDIEGNINNGQHRLAAVILSGIPIKTIFVKGLGLDAIKTIDTGMKMRSFADVLEIDKREKIKYSLIVAAAVPFVINFLKKRIVTKKSNRSSGISSTDFLNWIDINPDFIEFTQSCCKHYFNGDKLLNPKIFIGLQWILRSHSTINSESLLFFEYISTGANLEISNPVYFLRKKLLANKLVSDKRTRLNQREVVFCVIRTWNAFIKNEKLTRFVISKNLPNIEAATY